MLENYMDPKHTKGFTNHLVAVEWLTKQGYYVFDNISGLGPCDVIALDETGNTILIDIKSVTKRKDGSIINRVPTAKQRRMKIRLLMVENDKTCTLI
jgi:Holliday junction resolvase-like predicted endonuclease